MVAQSSECHEKEHQYFQINSLQKQSPPLSLYVCLSLHSLSVVVRKIYKKMSSVFVKEMKTHNFKSVIKFKIIKLTIFHNFFSNMRRVSVSLDDITIFVHTF